MDIGLINKDGRGPAEMKGPNPEIDICKVVKKT